MPIINSQILTTGLADSPTSFIYLQSNDTYATVTGTGYLNNFAALNRGQITIYQMALIYTTDQNTVLLQITYNTSTGNWTLVSSQADGTVATPTVANQIAYATNTAGALAAIGLSTALFNAGNLSAGISGTAGQLESYPATGSKGALILKAVANTGNTNVTISNAAFGQATVLSFADVGAATGDFLVVPSATLVSGNFPVNSGTAGLVVDSGVAASTLMSTAATNTMDAGSKILLDKGTGNESSHAVTINKQAGVITTTSLTTAGGATETITLTNTLITTSNVVVATIMGGTNTTPLCISATANSGSSTIVLSNPTAATAANGTVIIGFVVF